MFTEKVGKKMATVLSFSSLQPLKLAKLVSANIRMHGFSSVSVFYLSRFQ